MPLFASHYDSPIGGITLAADGTALCGLWFDGQKHFAASLHEIPEKNDSLAIFQQTRRWLDLYFAGETPSFTPPLSLNGTPFRQQVWAALLAIPYGQTTSYGTLAKSIALRVGQGSVSPRAVGNAVAHNPISLIVPCHRVIGADGRMTGYAGGLDRKAFLLRLEQGKEKRQLLC